MSSFWGEEDKEGDLKGCTIGAEIRRSKEVITVELELVG